MTKKVTDLHDIPNDIKEANTVIKVLFFWLEPQGQVTMSLREIAEALGFSVTGVFTAYHTLKDMGYLKEVVASKGSIPPTFEVNKKRTD